MDRKEFLKSVCGLGVCGCAAGLLAGAAPAVAADAAGEDQNLAFARHQLAKLVSFMGADVPAGACASVLEKTGRECAKLTRAAAKFKGNPEGYFAAAKAGWGAEIAWDREKRRVTIAVPEGPCACPLVDLKRTPALWCTCSVGYQKETFEEVFGRPVKVALKESKLTGGKRCVFDIDLS